MRSAIALAAVLSFLGMTSPAGAALVVTIGNATIFPNGTATVDVLVHSDLPSGDDLNSFGFEFRVVGSGSRRLEFANPQLDLQLSESNYLFAGDSIVALPPATPVGVVLTTVVPLDTFIGGDGTISENNVTIGATDLLLARLQFTAATSLPPVVSDTFSVQLLSTANTFFQDDSFTDVSFSSTLGTVTVAAEPSSGWLSTGGGVWANNSNWTGDLTPTGNTSTARLWRHLTTSGTIDLQGGTRTVKTLSFDNAVASYTVGGASGSKLQLEADSGNALIEFVAVSNTQNHAIAADLQFNSNTDIAAHGRTLSLSGQIDWNGKTVTLQNGTLEFNGANATHVLAGSTLAINAGATAKLAGASSGTSLGGVNVSNDGTLSVTGTNQSVGNLDGLGTTTLSNAANLTATRVRQAVLTIGDANPSAAKLTIAESGPNPFGDPNSVSQVGALTILSAPGSIGSPPSGGYAGPQLNYYGTLDLKNNDLVIESGMTLAQANDLIRAGQVSTTGLSWNPASAKGLTSSFANSGPLAGSTGLGVLRNDANGELYVKYTWYGDLNLDGIVDAMDFSRLDSGFAGSMAATLGQPGWKYGDINLDGRVDSFDYALMEAGYAAYTATGGNGGPATALPEPSTFVLGVLGVIGLLTIGQRRKSTARSGQHR